MTERSRSGDSTDDQFSVTSGTGQTAATSGTSSSTTPLPTGSSTYSSSPGTTASSSSGSASGAADQAKQAVSNAADQAKQAAGDLAGQAKEQASNQLSQQKERAASGLGGVADALRQTGESLEQNDQQAVGRYVNQAADQVERLQGYLQNQDLGGIIDDVERMAREQPVMFLGGSFVLGLLAARFLKSSGQRSQSGSSYGQSRGYTRSGYGGNYSSRSAGGSSSTYGRSGTTSGTSYGSGAGTGYAGTTSTSYGTARGTTTSDSEFLASSLTDDDVTRSTGSASDYSPSYGTGLAGGETSDRSSMGDVGGTSSGRNRESGSTEGA